VCSSDLPTNWLFCLRINELIVINSSKSTNNYTDNHNKDVHMKRLILTLLALPSLIATTAFAQEYVAIEMEIDVENRIAKVSVPGLIEGSGEPIRNPITGDIHQARIDIPYGFEYLIAEMGAGTSKSSGAIKMDLSNSYGQFAYLHLTNSGPVRKAA